jgi:heme/copper-type cytochrome/quinol oxidase subunit 4
MTEFSEARREAAKRATVQWFGEACIGLIPLGAYKLIVGLTTLPFKPALCDDAICTFVAESALPETCIVSVVVAGLAFLSLFNVGPHRRKAPFTIFTYVLAIPVLYAMIFGGMLYAITAVHIDRNADFVVWLTLAAALAGSLFLALEGAILDA